jgi:hypothetical protein
MTSRVAKPAARWIGVLWLALAVAGWFDSPVIGRHGLIGADQAMSIGHGVLGLYLLAMSLAGETTCAFALYSAAAACVTFAAYVLWQLGQYDSLQLFNTTYATTTNEYLHLGMGLAMAVFGKLNTASKQLFRE